jgi:photosystem II stability/assembly factor-like uncharacterized protein
MKKLITALFILLVISACEKYPEPGTEQLENFQFYLHGTQQMAQAGNELPEKVGVNVDLNSLYPDKSLKFHTIFEVLEGDGSIQNTRVDADAEGKMLTQWTMGTTQNRQLLKGAIYDQYNKRYGEFNLHALALFQDKENMVEEGLLIGIIDMLADTLRKRTMMLNQGMLWLLKDNFYKWEPKGLPMGVNIRFIDMTRDGTVFAAGWNGKLYKSENWGDNWELWGQPIPGNQHHYHFNITNNDYLWATKKEHGVFCSKDKGLTWLPDTTDRVKNTRLGPIYRYKNSYLALAGNPLTIIQKHDGDSIWSDMITPEYSISMYVPNDSTIIAQNQGGFRLHKSVDDGQTYHQVFNPNVSMGGGDDWHLYAKHGNSYFVLAPSNGLWQTTDFENFEQLIHISTHQQKLFTDHRGTLYVAGYNYSNAEPEATYILPHINK